MGPIFPDTRIRGAGGGRNSSPAKPRFRYAGRVFDENEVAAAVAATLDFWLTLGKEGEAFEEGLAQYLGVKKSVLCNSGSSANLLAVSALSSPKLGARRLKAGDEIITVAAGFPTTVVLILQNGFVPVFIDNDPVTLNAKAEGLEEAYSEGKTKAVIFAHTLGNPFNLAAVAAFCKKHELWLIEDNCDALGCTYDGRLTGTFGDLSTQSFYPPHHMTLGEGGAVNIVEQPEVQGDRGELSGLGAGLLVRERKGQYVRATVQLAVGGVAQGLRPQIHLLAPRL